ncbi:hypothetical protein [Streptomyces lydicus]|uniref:hypothetical protein n=1 Tax=Streptomyces lydicus TaxID=47763 RepID=UPI001010906D|nr:hypothetical protein [Streptomyces lydicus]MCZ1006536.1 hypothetical protein [Streptomyces lydicus]
MSNNAAAVAATLEAAAGLRLTAGLVNGDHYDEWYVEARPSLLLALAELARSQGASQLADKLDRFSHPLCMEPLDAVLSPGDMPTKWCLEPVEAAGRPCGLRTPDHAVELGRCTWEGGSRCVAVISAQATIGARNMLPTAARSR